ncbi:MAG: BamA/TamA family outer membrane protein, partial [Candidatus Rokubacteria bacterium]|nr:BamA/TamA family outer membrane protein [Candidatus Rokubacteria bacterium]
RTRSVSPRDETGARIGGDKELLFNADLLIPLIPRLRAALFFDAGNAYGFGEDFDPTDLRMAAGVGFRWFSPFGPVRVDYGFNLDREPGEKSAQFHFAIGSTF